MRTLVPVETLSITHIFDGEEVVMGGEDGQVWVATFADADTAQFFLTSLIRDVIPLVVGERRTVDG